MQGFFLLSKTAINNHESEWTTPNTAFTILLKKPVVTHLLVSTALMDLVQY